MEAAKLYLEGEYKEHGPFYNKKFGTKLHN